MIDLNRILEEQGFKKTPESPVTFSQVGGIVERLEVSRSMEEIVDVSILPGWMVPQARPENYDSELFDVNYVVYIKR